VTVVQWEGQNPALKMIEEFRHLGYPLDEYHRPAKFNYYYAGHAYLGTVLLFRGRIKSPISAGTLEVMAVMEPLLVFAFSDLVTRYHIARPVIVPFVRTLRMVWQKANLSNREMQVMALHLMGLSYAQIANRLFISKNTVAKHVKSAHRKTGCSSFLELFAPYFKEAAGEIDS
jgi:DNA-binding CsgD family transcriptional regulator